MASPISYNQITRSQRTPDGELTPTGIRAVQLFNTYTVKTAPNLILMKVLML
ncbi:hypothetical protein JQ616_29950 [Bradyrhizobium tropiciagri]|uniref:hypothetical protein n=1 Tax=Bradyrhizobium tropiciagri TaxID=312253 RepID=UPI001BA7C930|nr:hypothetical protein [Bradyrhizobium tropiciagri]MBR0899194.1 hypothetical protein [Bradyrhizobium tropiciagri]